MNIYHGKALYGCYSEIPILGNKTMQRYLPATAIMKLKLLMLSNMAKLLEVSGELTNFWCKWKTATRGQFKRPGWSYGGTKFQLSPFALIHPASSPRATLQNEI